jgi:integrase
VRGQRVEGTTKGGQSRTICLDRDTVTVLREHRRQQAAEQLAAGPAWTDTGGLVFVSHWGEPLYPDTVTALMTKLINWHNKSDTPPAKPLPILGSMICAACTRPRCSWQASRFTSSPPASATPTPP